MDQIGTKISEIRKRKGLSQEELSEQAKINLRTLQRVESGESSPRGNTLKSLCEVLELNIEEILDYRKKEDKNFLIVFHLSALAFLVMPIGNIIIPLILWLTKRDKIISLNEQGVALLNYQIIWTILAYTSLITPLLGALLHIDVGLRMFNLELFFGLYALNIIHIITVSVLVGNGSRRTYYPQIIKILR